MKKSFARGQASFTMNVNGDNVIELKLNELPEEMVQRHAVYGITKRLQDKFDTLKIEGEPGTAAQRIEACKMLCADIIAGRYTARRSFALMPEEQETMDQLTAMGLDESAIVALIKAQRKVSVKKEEETVEEKEIAKEE